MAPLIIKASLTNACLPFGGGGGVWCPALSIVRSIPTWLAMALDGSRHMKVYVRLLIDAKPSAPLKNSMSLARKVRKMASACGASTSAVSSGACLPMSLGVSASHRSVHARGNANHPKSDRAFFAACFSVACGVKPSAQVVASQPIKRLRWASRSPRSQWQIRSTAAPSRAGSLPSLR